MICIANITAHRQAEELAHEVIFEARANDLPFVVEVLGADETDDTVYEKWIEASREAVSSRFQSELIHFVVRLCGKSAALAGFKIHDVLTLPEDVAAAAVMFENLLAPITN